MNRGSTFTVVDDFERELEKFTGAPHAVAVSTGTAAIFLALVREEQRIPNAIVHCPAHTFISVPMAVLHANLALKLVDQRWVGACRLMPTRVVDAALRFRHNMYEAGTLTCLSFHARKHLNIGEGGAILTDSAYDARWLRAARNSGREEPDFNVTEVRMLGWQAYMTPEKAARGLHILSYLPGDLPDQSPEYPDLRACPIFKEHQ